MPLSSLHFAYLPITGSSGLRKMPFIGNPYFIEHVYDTTTAFFVGDWVYALVVKIFLLFGFSFVFATVLSTIFWSVLTSILLYALYYVLELPSMYRNSRWLFRYAPTPGAALFSGPE